jgi:uncharacterized protein YecT (DUF1311 family)
MKYILAAALPLLLCWAAAQAAPSSKCDDSASQTDMTLCAENNYKAADAMLNKTYRDLLQALPDESRKAKLKAAQRAWVVFRDAQCTYHSSEMEGGSAEPLLFAGCAATETALRINYLARELKCLGKPC